jgi:flavin reductase (DIM6/NTAB) family NADH-FMN oxidoreductase RutF
VLDAAAFLVHLLDSRNAALARRFATPGADRFGPATPWSRLPTGEPLLTEAPVALRCRPLVQVPIGRATVVTAEVVEVLGTIRTGRPLVYHQRRFHALPPGAELDVPS